jgi:hypothetical protein
MLKKLRRALADVKQQKHKHFDDFEKIIKRCRAYYPHLFPNYEETKGGSKTVFHFNVEGVSPISLEKEHGKRDHVPSRYAKFAIQGIEDLLDFIEMNATEEQDENGDENADESAPGGQEASGVLPEPKIPNGGSGG